MKSKNPIDQEYPDYIPCVRCMAQSTIQSIPEFDTLYYCEECDIYFTKDGKIIVPETCDLCVYGDCDHCHDVDDCDECPCLDCGEESSGFERREDKKILMVKI